MAAVASTGPAALDVERGASTLRRHYNLTRELAITQFKLKYTGSVLGYVWSMLKPLAYFGVMYVVFVYLFKIGGSSPNFTMQLLLGIVVYTFVAEATATAMNSIAGNGGMLRKAYFPRIIPVIASTLTAVFTFLINLVMVLVIGALLHQIDLGWQSLLAPLLLVEIYVFVIGLSLFLSSVFVTYRDLGHIWEIVVQLLFYASAVMFPFTLLTSKSNLLAKGVAANPIAQVIEDLRRTLIADSPQVPYAESVLDHNWVWLPLSVVGLTLLIGSLVFRRLAPRFAESL